MELRFTEAGSGARFSEVASEWGSTCAAATGLVIRVDDQEVPDLQHLHTDFCALYVVRRGRGMHVVDGVPYGIARGDVYAMGAGATHGYTQHDDLVLDAIYFRLDALQPEERRILLATPGFFSVLGGQFGGGKWLHLDPVAYGVVRGQFEELRREWQRGDESGALLTRGLFVRLLLTLSRLEAGAAPPARRIPATVAVADAVRLLDERHSRPVRISEVAREVGLCADHLTVAFAEVMGRTPRDYLRHVRVERGKALLERTDLPVGEIALQAGFSDAPHFVRTFRAKVGVTPGAYRAQRAAT